MNLEAKKKVLRSFTYGLYVLTAKDGDEVAAGEAAAAVVRVAGGRELQARVVMEVSGERGGGGRGAGVIS